MVIELYIGTKRERERKKKEEEVERSSKRIETIDTMEISCKGDCIQRQSTLTQEELKCIFLCSSFSLTALHEQQEKGVIQ